MEILKQKKMGYSKLSWVPLNLLPYKVKQE